MINDFDMTRSYHVGIVAIPENFNILEFMSIKEQCNLFPADDIDISQITLLISLLNTQSIWVCEPTHKITPNTIKYFFNILDELDLLLHHIDAGETNDFVIVNVLCSALKTGVEKALRRITNMEDKK